MKTLDEEHLIGRRVEEIEMKYNISPISRNLDERVYVLERLCLGTLFSKTLLVSLGRWHNERLLLWDSIINNTSIS